MTAKYQSADVNGPIQWTAPDGVVWTIPNYDSPTNIGQQFRNWVDAGGTIDPYVPPPPPVPGMITRRQCAVEMRERSMITPLECLNMTKNADIPAFVETIFSAMSPEDRILAETDFAAANYYRDNPLLVAMMTATGATSADIDQFFRDANTR